METTNLPPMPDPSAQQPDTGNSNQGHKKALLQKLMSNLLGKPGRSMHEIIDGVKQAIGAYKNYAKEWDTLNGVVAPTVGSSTGASAGGSQNNIRSIMDQIQQQKAKAAPAPIPTIQPVTPPPSAPVTPPMPQNQAAPLIAGQPQTSTFNRPAPVSNLGIHGF